MSPRRPACFRETISFSGVKRVFLLLLFPLSTLGQSATKTITSREQAWVAYAIQARLASKFGVWFDIQYRRTGDFIDRPFQLFLRPGAIWYIRDNLRFSTGYSYTRTFPPEGYNTAVPEHRGWQQLWLNQRIPGLSTTQALRLEQRFFRNIKNDALVDGYLFINRVRYMLQFTVPLKGKELKASTPFAVVSDEIFINFGKNVTYNTFDQNRVYFGLGYLFTSQLNAQLGYLYIFQQLPTGVDYFRTHVIRLSVAHSLDLR